MEMLLFEIKKISPDEITVCNGNEFDEDLELSKSPP